MKKVLFINILIIIISIVISIIAYPHLPDLIATHWNFKNKVNGYTPKYIGLFIIPFISSILLALFTTIPNIDPLKENIQKFRLSLDTFTTILLLFLLYIHILTILLNLGYKFNLIQLLSPALGIVFYFTGRLISQSRRNWFIGIRTPWTLSSEEVWNRTNKLGGLLFEICGALCFFPLLLPVLALEFIILPVIATVIFIIVYSYLQFNKTKQ